MLAPNLRFFNLAENIYLGVDARGRAYEYEAGAPQNVRRSARYGATDMRWVQLFGYVLKSDVERRNWVPGVGAAVVNERKVSMNGISTNNLGIALMLVLFHEMMHMLINVSYSNSSLCVGAAALPQLNAADPDAPADIPYGLNYNLGYPGVPYRGRNYGCRSGHGWHWNEAMLRFGGCMPHQALDVFYVGQGPHVHDVAQRCLTSPPTIGIPLE